MRNDRYWLWFVIAFNPGNSRIWDFLSYYKDVIKAYEAVCSGEHPSLNANEKRKIKTTHLEQCDNVISFCREKGIAIVTYEDEDYPVLLRRIPDPPALLFCRGDLDNFNSRPAVACVGTREPSQYSLDVCRRICTELSERGFAIVSGFALGLDSAAHEAAIHTNGCTAAVLACGIDVDYPKPNAKAKEVIEQNGVILSEYLPGMHPNAFTFQTRNRIMSGLAFATLVTEAAEGSGALITADHAIDQGRALFCIPPSDLFDKRYSGVIKYIRDGACCAFSAFDIMYEYYTSESFKHLSGNVVWPESWRDDEGIAIRTTRRVKAKEKKKEEEEQARDEAVLRADELAHSFSDIQQRIVSHLRKEGRTLDELCMLCQMDTIEMMTLVTELEIMGAIEFQPDRKYVLC